MLVGRGGGIRGTKIVNKHFVNKLAFPTLVPAQNCMNFEPKHFVLGNRREQRKLKPKHNTMVLDSAVRR